MEFVKFLIWFACWGYGCVIIRATAEELSDRWPKMEFIGWVLVGVFTVAMFLVGLNG